MLPHLQYVNMIKCLSCGYARKDFKMDTIDWTDETCQITEHFTVKEALYLHQWERLGNETDGLNDDIKNNLINLCGVMEKIRALLGNIPIKVHCMYRPPAYSQLVGGTAHDVHVTGLACDFDSMPDMTCDKIKELLVPQLEALNIRLENNGLGALWCHIDTHPVISQRYFNP